MTETNQLHWFVVGDQRLIVTIFIGYLRSLSFVQISALYAELIPWARQHNLKIIDITKYSQDERRLLSPYMHSLELAYSKIHTLLDTVGYMRGCRAVVTVDTALIHMASWFGNPTLLLLHQHPDERWFNRPLGLDQTHPVVVLNQVRYNYWGDIAHQLLHSLSKWPWL